jgi:hypothetical protein
LLTALAGAPPVTRLVPEPGHVDPPDGALRWVVERGVGDGGGGVGVCVAVAAPATRHRRPWARGWCVRPSPRILLRPLNDRSIMLFYVASLKGFIVFGAWCRSEQLIRLQQVFFTLCVVFGNF